jgi:hypothetical protein
VAQGSGIDAQFAQTSGYFVRDRRLVSGGTLDAQQTQQCCHCPFTIDGEFP